MLSGISITCFAASYSVSLVLELTRLLFRSGVRGTVMLGFAVAGLFAHTAYLYYRAATTVDSPLSSEHDWYLLAAWVLTAAYIYLTYAYPKTAFGLVVLPLVLGLVAVAALAADRVPFAREPASRIWGVIHGMSILVATVTVLVGASIALMHFRQVYRLKHKLPLRGGLRLPSLEWLQRMNGRAILLSALMLGVGVLSGAILNDIRLDETMPWYDPVVVSTLGMFAWLTLCALVAILHRPAEQGNKIALLTLASFVFLLIVLSFSLLFNTRHGSLPPGSGAPSERIGMQEEPRTQAHPTASCRTSLDMRLPFHPHAPGGRS